MEEHSIATRGTRLSDIARSIGVGALILLTLPVLYVVAVWGGGI